MLRTNIQTMKTRYELAYNQLLNELPAWKRNSVIAKEDCWISDEFYKAVAILAEDTTIELVEPQVINTEPVTSNEMEVVNPS